MAGDVVGREAELAQLSRLLDAAAEGPCRLVVTGEAGVGKSTLLRAGARLAEEQGWQVLGAQPSGAEVQLGYAGLGDLAAPLLPRLAALPGPQRDALCVALLLAPPPGPQPAERTVAAATLTLLQDAARERPTLLVLDDPQWLDQPTRAVVAFALRRLRGRAALLVGTRDQVGAVEDLQVADAGRSTTLPLAGLSLAALHALIAARSGRRLSRPVVEQVAALARGNPLFALEIARGIDTDAGPVSAPPSLTASLAGRIRSLPEPTQQALLVASLLARPSYAALRRAHGDDVETDLKPAEADGVVRWSSGVLEFAHPLWREAARVRVPPFRLRELHRALGELADDIEERARHRALGTVGADAATVASLVAAADAARSRGATSAAAELLELAIGAGAQDPSLHLAAAWDHLAADDPHRARALAGAVVDRTPTGPLRAGALWLLGAATVQVDDFTPAVAVLRRAWEAADGDRRLRAEIAVDLATALGNGGDAPQALAWNERALVDALAVGASGLAAEARAGTAAYRFLLHHRLDQALVEQALAEEDPGRLTSAIRWPTVSAAMLALWSLDLDRARAGFDRAVRRCRELGVEGGAWIALARGGEACLWAGDLEAAQRLFGELAERAALAGSRHQEVVAAASRTYLAAWCGDLEASRAGAEEVLAAAATGGGAHVLPLVFATAASGDAELCAGEAATAADRLAPLAGAFGATGLLEPVMTPFLPSYVEALVATRRTDAAHELVVQMKAYAAASGRPWAAGVAARCHGLLLAQAGDLDGAQASYADSLRHLDAPGLRHDRARTLLVLARLHRRRRARGAAAGCLREAARLFTELGRSGWAEVADRERELCLPPETPGVLTPGELRVAELAGAGLTNAAIAARLGISPKTVEASLARSYRKLGLHSRAQLGGWHRTRRLALDDVGKPPMR